MRRLILLLTLLLLLTPLVRAQDTTQNEAGQTTNATVASLGTPLRLGAIRYVRDGTIGSIPCTGGGLGAFAFWNGTQWNCGSGGSGGTPGGANTQVQYNDSGVFGGNVGFTFNKSTGNAVLNGSLTTGNAGGVSGCIALSGATSGTATLCAASVAGTFSGVMPLANGTAHQRIEDDGAGNLSFQSGPYDLAFQIDGLPTISQVGLRFVAVRAFTLSATGHRCSAGTAATAQTDFILAVNGTTKDTLRFAASGTTCSIVGGTQTSIAAGDVITVTAPASPDVSLANIAVTLFGTYP